MKFYKYGDTDAPFGIIFLFTIIEIVLTVIVALMLTIVVWDYVQDLTSTTRSILNLYIFLANLFIVVKFKDIIYSILRA